MTYLFYICVAICLLMIVKCQEEVVVNTTLGQIIGIRKTLPAINTTIDIYLKIPYAKPPVGNLRFEKPQPHGPWNDTLNAKSAGPSCFQTLGAYALLYLQNKEISEDCLHLNIYVPNDDSVGSNKSVMVWIHGGGFSNGQAQLYNGQYLAGIGDVIVVTINYRLNVFGFLATSDIKGNYGLWDQILAIQWVKDNIESFGGNSKSITIFGESAGGFSVGLLSIVPSNRGLFQKAIFQSGAANSVYAIGATTKQSSEKLARLVNCTESDRNLFVQCLKDVDANDILKSYASTNFRSSFFTIPFAPVVDGELLKEDPNNVLEDKNSAGYSFYQSLDVVIGTVSGEGSLLLNTASGNLENILQFNMSDHIPKRILCDVIAPDMAFISFNNNTRISSAICEKYGKATNVIKLSLNILDAFTDFTFNIPAAKSLHVHSYQNIKKMRYQYIFSRPLPINISGNYPTWFNRAEHASETVFQFPSFAFSTSDFMLATYFMKYWAHFAKTGNMDVPGQPQWNEYDKENGHYINFDVPITTGQHLYKDRVSFWLTDIPSFLQTSAGSSLYYIQLNSIVTLYVCFNIFIVLLWSL